MYYIYVLKSIKTNKRYIGYTEKDPQIRLGEHNSGTNHFTSRHKPFVLLYSEGFPSKDKAMIRERFLKTGQGRNFLNKIIPP